MNVYRPPVVIYPTTRRTYLIEPSPSAEYFYEIVAGEIFEIRKFTAGRFDRTSFMRRRRGTTRNGVTFVTE